MKKRSTENQNAKKDKTSEHDSSTDGLKSDDCYQFASKRTKRMDPSIAIHPLLIDHVLEKVFTSLIETSSINSGNCLLDCRLVCKRWHETGTKVFRHLDTTEVSFSYADTEKMRKFMCAMINSELLLFRKFRFDVNFFISENENLFQSFMQNCTPFITHLSLCFGKNFTMDFFGSTEKFQRVDLSRLQFLSFKCTYLNTMTSVIKLSEPVTHQLSNTSQYEGLLSFLEILLKSAPNLEIFDFCDPSRHFINTDDLRFGDLLARSLPKKVTVLKLIMKIGKEHLEKLQELKLALKTFHVNFCGSSLPKTSLLQFLDSLKQSLIDLNIADMENEIAEKLEFPRLPGLTILEINGGINSNFSYLKSFPNLKNIILRNGRNDNIDLESLTENLDNYGIYTSVQGIELTNSTIRSNLIRRIAHCFPNLRKFRLQIAIESDSALQTVFEVMPFLEILRVEFPNFFENLSMDTIFTGIPTEQCRILLETHQNFSNSDLSFITRKPNLTNLTELKELSIKSQSYSIVLTNLTAHFALLQMNKLESVEMERFNITPEYFERLKSQFKVREPDSSNIERNICSKSFSNPSLLFAD